MGRDLYWPRATVGGGLLTYVTGTFLSWEVQPDLPLHGALRTSQLLGIPQIPPHVSAALPLLRAPPVVASACWCFLGPIPSSAPGGASPQAASRGESLMLRSSRDGTTSPWLGHPFWALRLLRSLCRWPEPAAGPLLIPAADADWPRLGHTLCSVLCLIGASPRL